MPDRAEPVSGEGGAGASDRFLSHYLPFLLTRADALLSQPLLDVIVERGRSVPEWRILTTLHHHDGLPVGVVADLTLLPQPTVSRWVDRLTDQGYVNRQPSDADRRVTVVRITSAGRAIADEMIALATKQWEDTTAGIPPAELDRLERAVRAVIRRLDPTHDLEP